MFRDYILPPRVKTNTPADLSLPALRLGLQVCQILRAGAAPQHTPAASPCRPLSLSDPIR